MKASQFPASQSALSTGLGMTAPRLDRCTTENLVSYFEHTWAIYEWLFSSIRSDKYFYLSPDPLRNPLVFYFGHTAAFYVNKLKISGLISEGVHPRYDHIFAVGVDPADASELANQPGYPNMNTVREYRAEVKALVLNFLNSHQFPEKVGPSDPEWAILMALEHDRIHFETSSVLIRQMPTELLQKPVAWKYADFNLNDPNEDWIEIEGGKVTIGQLDPKYFAWDNEFGKLEVEVASFSVRSCHVTNSEFLDFVMDEGYENPELWTEAGWNWLQGQQRSEPRFWVRNGLGYRYRAMFDEMEMPLDWPVEVTCHEALAYCKWAGEGNRLMSEAEWRLLADDALQKAAAVDADSDYLLHVRNGSPRPASLSKDQGSLGVVDIFGNVWDWIGDNFYPLPEFAPHPYYEDFSKLYFDEDHGMMLGGSWATTGTGARNFYRLWFRHGFMQHAGFRMAKSKG